jgi:hypothetical protein
MASTDLIAGRIEVTANGNRLQAAGAFKIRPGTPKREELVGPDGLHGVKEMPTAPGASGTIRNNRKLNVPETIGNMQNATIVITLCSGKQYLLEDCVYKGDLEIDTENAEIPFDCVASSCTEITV